MHPILSGAIIFGIFLSIGAGTFFFLLHSTQDMREKATLPLILQCQKCGKVVYESRTGSIKEPFTAVVICVPCASKKKFIQTYGPDAKMREY
jgi:formylmethanofuran dehydrogenase subunit E